MKWNVLHLRPRVESITEDNVESNCSMTRKNPPKGVSFSDLICIFAMSIVEFSCLFCNTKISKFFDMKKFWATFVAQVLKKFKLQ